MKYLNSRPLIARWPGTALFDHPAQLALDLAAGNLDAALVPVFALFEHPEFFAVDGIGIVSDGPVYSVYLAHRGPIERTTVLLADTASRTSLHLAQVLLREMHGVTPEVVRSVTISTPSELGDSEAALLIGNQAIEFREAHRDAVEYLDLGKAWKEFSGLPFVYAVWLVRRDFAGALELADSLRAAANEGRTAIGEIVLELPESERKFARRYLTQHIHFTVGPLEKRGMQHFRDLCLQHRFVTATGNITWLGGLRQEPLPV